MKPTIETYWAVRIGRHPMNIPYFMLGQSTVEGPALYETRAAALAAASTLCQKAWAVKVRVSEVAALATKEEK